MTNKGLSFCKQKCSHTSLTPLLQRILWRHNNGNTQMRNLRFKIFLECNSSVGNHCSKWPFQYLKSMLELSFKMRCKKFDNRVRFQGGIYELVCDVLRDTHCGVQMTAHLSFWHLYRHLCPFLRTLHLLHICGALDFVVVVPIWVCPPVEANIGL